MSSSYAYYGKTRTYAFTQTTDRDGETQETLNVYKDPMVTSVVVVFRNAKAAWMESGLYCAYASYALVAYFDGTIPRSALGTATLHARS